MCIPLLFVEVLGGMAAVMGIITGGMACGGRKTWKRQHEEVMKYRERGSRPSSRAEHRHHHHHVHSPRTSHVYSTNPGISPPGSVVAHSRPSSPNPPGSPKLHHYRVKHHAHGHKRPTSGEVAGSGAVTPRSHPDLPPNSRPTSLPGSGAQTPVSIDYHSHAAIESPSLAAAVNEVLRPLADAEVQSKGVVIPQTGSEGKVKAKPKKGAVPPAPTPEKVALERNRKDAEERLRGAGIVLQGGEGEKVVM